MTDDRLHDDEYGPAKAKVDPGVWDQWDLRGLLQALNLPSAQTGVVGLSTTVLFLVLKDYDWPGRLEIYHAINAEGKRDLDFQHTCLKWKGQVLDIRGQDHAAFAVSQDFLDPSAQFVLARPMETQAQLVQNMPNLTQILNTKLQALLMQAQTPRVEPTGQSRPRL